MAIARHGAGPTADLGALASQVHPVFMLPPLAASAFGAVLAREFAPALAAVHLVAVFFGLYTAHLKDGYVDFHVRGEDDDHPLTERGCRLALAGSTLGFFLALAAVTALVGPVAGLLTLPGWLIGYLHAPQLDTNPVTATAGYPTGIALALVGGFYVQAGTVTPVVAAFAGIFLVALSGVKVIDDATDVAYDRSIGKRTVAVVLGPARARSLAYLLMGVGMFVVVALAVDGVFPPSAPVAAVAFAVVAAVAYRAPPELATMLLVRGAYLFLALLVAAVWFRPLAVAALPDITVLGPYTYLATEVAFGSAAALALWYADAWWAAARTVAVCYPVAYVWDWYTLEVGVFSIPMRTGVDLLGIPVEEHLFMLVVPAFVVGVHETLRTAGEPKGSA
ncbi:lycopene cyclase domain-containing protein [Halorarius halobius]|uniref:lycopene cyclase domain-containing protein n=1 Tax=Halorarius halobius TaxID=2962671 RepID=UPI00331437B6